MPDSTPSRRRLIEAALTVLAEERVSTVSLSFLQSDGSRLVVDVVRLPARKIGETDPSHPACSPPHGT
jgi:hypothetical protein